MVNGSLCSGRETLRDKFYTLDKILLDVSTLKSKSEMILQRVFEVDAGHAVFPNANVVPGCCSLHIGDDSNSRFRTGRILQAEIIIFNVIGQRDATGR